MRETFSERKFLQRKCLRIELSPRGVFSERKRARVEGRNCFSSFPGMLIRKRYDSAVVS